MANLFRTTRLQTAWNQSGQQNDWHGKQAKGAASLVGQDKKAARKRKKAERKRKAQGRK